MDWLAITIGFIFGYALSIIIEKFVKKKIECRERWDFELTCVKCKYPMKFKAEKWK